MKLLDLLAQAALQKETSICQTQARNRSGGLSRSSRRCTEAELQSWYQHLMVLSPVHAGAVLHCETQQ